MKLDYLWPVLLAVVVVTVIMLSTRKYRKEHSNYDEMQILYRARGYKIGFFTMMIILALEIFMEAVLELRIAETSIYLFLPIMIGVTVYGCYNIIRGSFFSVGDDGMRYTLMIGVVAVCEIIGGLPYLIKGNIIKDGLIRFEGANSLLMGLCFLAMAITSAVMMFRSRKEANDEES